MFVSSNSHLAPKSVSNTGLRVSPVVADGPCVDLRQPNISCTGTWPFHTDIQDVTALVPQLWIEMPGKRPLSTDTFFSQTLLQNHFARKEDTWEDPGIIQKRRNTREAALKFSCEFP